MTMNDHNIAFYFYSVCDAPITPSTTVGLVDDELPARGKGKERQPNPTQGGEFLGRLVEGSRPVHDASLSSSSLSVVIVVNACM